MAFCKYCGTQYPDGGACTNPACPGANKVPTPPVPPVSPVPQENNPFVTAINEKKPSNNKNLIIGIVVIAVILAVIAGAVIVAVVLNNKKKEEEESQKKDSHKYAVETYAENLYDKKGFDNYKKVSLLEDVYKEYKKTDDYDDDKDYHKDNIEDMNDYDVEISLDKVKKQEKLSEDVLDAAEEYFEDQAYDYDVDIDDIEIKGGYEYKVTFEQKEDGEKETITRRLCVVEVKGDGWKVINYSADDLEYYYG